MNIQKVDLTSPGQKVVAGFLAVGVLFLLYKILPIMVIIAVLGWKALFLCIPLLFIAWNWEIFWNMFQALSIQMTKKIIGFTKIEQHEIYYRHAESDFKEIQEGVKSLTASVISEEKALAKLKARFEENSRLALQYDSMGKTSLANEYSGKARIDERTLATNTPQYESLKSVRDNLNEVMEEKRSKLETLRYSIDAEIEQWERWKEISKVSGIASKLMNNNSPEYQNYKEAQKQTEREINEWMADYETMSTEMKPVLEAAKANKAIDAIESQSFLEKLKQKKEQGNA